MNRPAIRQAFAFGDIVVRAFGPDEIGRVTAVFRNLSEQTVCKVLWASGRHSHLRADNLLPATDEVPR